MNQPIVYDSENSTSNSSSSNPVGYAMSRVFGATDPNFNFKINALSGSSNKNEINVNGNINSGTSNINNNGEEGLKFKYDSVIQTRF